MEPLKPAIKATTHSVRATNTALILQHVSGGGGAVSRADLVRTTGLNTATVSTVVAELIERGLLREVGYGPSAGGKPPVLLDLDEERHAILAVQVLPHGFRLAEVSLRGEILSHQEGPLDPAAAVPGLAEAIDVAARTRRELLAVGVAAPGLVDDAGVVTRSVPMGWSDVDLAGALSAAIGRPAHVLNDSQAAALAEVTLLDEALPSLMALYIGEGVGAGLVLSGRLFRGEHFTAGEVGHMNLRTHRLTCSCGRVGCLEAAASIDVLTGDVPAPGAAGAPVRSGAAIDPRAGRRAARNIAALLELAHDLINVRRTVICGPVCNLGPELLELLHDELAASEPYQAGQIAVDYSQLGDRGALLGAAASAAREELGLLLGGSRRGDPDALGRAA
jgi:predicted NBD/HSP70 family sugar kinase